MSLLTPGERAFEPSLLGLAELLSDAERFGEFPVARSGTGSLLLDAREVAPAAANGSLLLDGSGASQAPAAAAGSLDLAAASAAIPSTIGTGSLTFDAGGAVFAATGATGSLSLSLSAAGDLSVTAPLAGTGDFTATATATPFVTAPLAGTGIFTATRSVVRIVAAPLAGTGTFTATRIVLSVAAPLTGTGTFTATRSVVRIVAAPLAGTGDFTAAVTVLAVAAPLTGAGDFTATVTALAVTAPLTGAGAFTATAAVVRVVTAPLIGAGVFTATVTALAVTAALTGTGVFSVTAVVIEVKAPYLLVLNGTVAQSPGSITVSMAHLAPRTLVTFAIDGITVATEVSDTQGDILTFVVPVDRQFGAGTHTVSAVTTSTVTSAPFTISVSAEPLPTTPAADLGATQPGAPGTNGVYKWVFQDPGGLGSWAMPINPSAMTNPHVRKTVASVATTSVLGRSHVSEGASPVEWEFSGFCPNLAFHSQLVAYSLVRRRFYVIDHRNRAWTVSITSLDIRPRKRVLEQGVVQDWLADYTVRVALFDQTPQALV